MCYQRNYNLNHTDTRLHKKRDWHNTALYLFAKTNYMYAVSYEACAELSLYSNTNLCMRTKTVLPTISFYLGPLHCGIGIRYQCSTIARPLTFPQQFWPPLPLVLGQVTQWPSIKGPWSWKKKAPELCRQSVTNTFLLYQIRCQILFGFQKSHNTKYRIIFGIEKIWIPNTKYYSQSRKLNTKCE